MQLNAAPHTPPRPRWLDAALLAVLLANVAILVAGIAAVRTSPRLQVGVPVPGTDGCAWQLPAVDHSPGRCIEALGGVSLVAESLARHPIYFDNAASFDLWRAHQAAIDHATRGQAEVTVQLRPHDHAPAQVVLPLEAPSWTEAIYRMLPTSITVLFITGVAVLVVSRRPRQRAALALLVLCESAVLCSLAAMVMASRGLTLSPAWAYGLPSTRMIGGIIGLIALIELLMVFPVEWVSAARRRWLSVGMGALLAISSAAWFAGVFSAPMVYTIALVVAALVAIGLVTRRIESPTARLQGRWVLWGVAVPIVAWGLVRLPAVLGFQTATEPSDAIMMVASNAIPLGLAVAILRHNLFDIELFIRRTAIGAGVTALVLVGYHAGLTLFASEVSRGSATGTGTDTILVVALVLAFALMPLQKRLEGFLDRTFARNRFHYRRTLADLTDRLAGFDHPSALATHVLHTLASAMEVPRVVLALDVGGKGWEVGPDHQVAERPLAVPAGVLSLLEHRTDPWVLGEGEPGNPVDAWLNANQLVVGVPLSSGGTWMGLLGCASPPGSQLLSHGDLEAMRSLGGSLALALGHALALQKIRDMNSALEHTVESRTKELSSARLKLFQWEKMASLGALAAGVAHELNTPLGVIQSTADLLYETLPEASRPRRMARLCADAAGRATSIVGNLRAFSRPERQGLERVDIHESLEVTLRLLDGRLRRRAVTVAVEPGDVAPIHAFPAMLHQTLSNLLINAADASPNDSTVTVRTRPQPGGGVRIEVDDQGPGVPAHLQPRIFEPFFTTKAPGDGTGLGLSLCYAFVRQHGGTIRVEDAPAGGARFIVELPLRPPPEVLEPPAATGA